MNSESHATSRRSFLKHLGVGALTGGIAGAAASRALSPEEAAAQVVDGEGGGEGGAPPATRVTAAQVAADPTDIPAPIHRSRPKRHEVLLEVQNVTAEIEPGVTFDFMTFNGRIPGPMIRVRQGDTVHLTLRNSGNALHNVDLHAVYGTGGGNVATTALPGKEASVEFKALYPGAFIYHCAVPGMDYHISSGMFGMIVVEPPEGLPEVDREFYLGQNEVYTRRPAGEKGHHLFDFQAMVREDPSYVLLNGEKNALTADRHGAIQAKVGETARVFFVCGGPNLGSSFHPIGNVWKKAWSAGALTSEPQRWVQTMAVPPGSCGVFEMEFPVPGEVKLVDHALSRVARKGMLGVIEVEGPDQVAIFNPNPGRVSSS